MQLRVAPRYVFDRLPEWGERPRFVVGSGAARRVVTWGDLARSIRSMAGFVRARGVRPGGRVAIVADNDVTWIVAALAVQSSGGVVVPVHASCTADQAAYVVQHSESTIVFVDAAHFAHVLAAPHAYDSLDAIVALDRFPPEIPERIARRTIDWTSALTTGRVHDDADATAFDRALDATRLEDDALLVYTSGTTGEPKGVPLTHHAFALNWTEWLEATAKAMPSEAIDLLWLPLSHVFGFGEMWIGNALGFVTHLADPRDVCDRIPEVRPSVLLAVPSLWEKIATNGTKGTDRLKFCVSGGAALSRTIKETLLARGMLVLEGYGLTETSPTLTINRPDAHRFDSVGKPLPCVELRLADDGEILARGPTVFRGYHRDEESTRADARALAAAHRSRERALASPRDDQGVRRLRRAALGRIGHAHRDAEKAAKSGVFALRRRARGAARDARAARGRVFTACVSRCARIRGQMDRWRRAGSSCWA